MDGIKKYLTSKEFFATIIVVIVFVIFYLVLRYFINRIIAIKKDKISKRRLGYIKKARALLRYFLILVAMLVILRVNGVDVNSMLAGVGIVSVISGLALQDVLKDAIASFNLVVDKFFAVGDIVEINGMKMEVMEMQLKTTKFKDVDSGKILTIVNRNISEAVVLANYSDLDIPLPYELSVEEAKKIINIIMEKVDAIRGIDEVEYRNITEFGDSAVLYRLRIHGNAKILPQVLREAREIVKVELNNNKLSIPYKQLVIRGK